MCRFLGCLHDALPRRAEVLRTHSEGAGKVCPHEVEAGLVNLSDPYLTRAKSTCVNGWRPHNEFEAREGRIAGASCLVDRLKAFEFLRPTNANEHGRF